MDWMEDFEIVDFDQRSTLPHTSGIYVIFDDRDIHYIGKSTNLHKRLKNVFRHNKLWRINSIEEKRIGFRSVLDTKNLDQYERQYIRKLKPGRNETHKNPSKCLEVKFRVCKHEYGELSVMADEKRLTMSDFMRELVAFYKKNRTFVEKIQQLLDERDSN